MGLLGFIQSFRGDPEDELGAWRYLCRAVQTRAWRHHRTARRRPIHRSLDEEVGDTDRSPSLADLVVDIESPDPLERTIADARVVERRELFAQLPADWRAVLALGALGHGPREIARLLGMSERQVRRRVHKAHARLAGPPGRDPAPTGGALMRKLVPSDLTDDPPIVSPFRIVRARRFPSRVLVDGRPS